MKSLASLIPENTVFDDEITLYQAILASAEDTAIMVYDLDDRGRVVYANDAASACLRIDRATLLTMTPDQWDIHCTETDIVSMELAPGQPLRFETEYETAAGVRIPVEVSFSRVNMPGRNLIQSMSRDLRPQRDMASRAWRLEMRALEMRLERGYKDVYDNLIDGIFLVDIGADGSFIIAGYNQRTEMLLKTPESEAIGKPVEDVLPPDASSKLLGMYSTCLADGTSGCYRTELNLPGSERVHLENTLIPLSNPDRRIHRIVCISRDVTERVRRESQETARARVFDRLLAGAGLTEVLAEVTEFAEQLLFDLQCCILLSNNGKPFFERAVSRSLPGNLLKDLVCTPYMDPTVSDESQMWFKKPFFIEDAGTYGDYFAFRDQVIKSELVSFWSMPIVDCSGEMLGVLALFGRKPAKPDGQDLIVMEHVRQLACLVIERHRTEARVRYQAEYDLLTDLPNRTYLRERLADLVSNSQRLAVLYIDLDHFKEINDTLGHHMGDQMLIDVARRLKATVGPGNLIARISGDEFIVVLVDYDSFNSVELVSESVRAALTGDYAINHIKVWGSVSIGIALYPEQSRDVDELLRNADQALFAAKTEGRNCLSYFNQLMLEKAQLRMRLSKDLRIALSSGQLSLRYQPIVDTISGQIYKAEALLRWEHPELGQVSPALFIPIAEEAGLINEIGNWVFREAVRVSVAWNRVQRNGEGAARCISVNRSPLQFFTREGVDEWLAYLRNNDIHGAFVGVEITEGLLLDDRPEVMQQLKQLRKAGVSISLDDFGTGFSALSYLKKFDIDILKIDGSFMQDIVSDARSRSIVESIIVMASRLDIELIAEGVEESAQVEILAAAGVSLIQGYLFSKPLTEAEFLDFVSPHTEWLF